MTKQQNTLAYYLPPRCTHNVGVDKDQKIKQRKRKKQTLHRTSYQRNHMNNAKNSGNRFSKIPDNMPHTQHAMTQIRPALFAALPNPTSLNL